MHPFLTLLLAAPLLLPLGARAQTATPVVIELFTSQGCSSCPPADALLTELAEHEGVIALALHVDYWDYLGWADSFGRPEHSARQRAYAKAARHRSIYTPEMIVQGEKHVKGHDAERVLARIGDYQQAPPRAEIALERDGDALVIRLLPMGPPVGPADVHLVRLIPSEQVVIAGGENAGREVTYTNIVTDWETIARWDGEAPFEFRREGVAEGPLAVIVQEAPIGPIVTAAEIP